MLTKFFRTVFGINANDSFRYISSAKYFRCTIFRKSWKFTKKREDALKRNVSNNGTV